VDFFCKVMFCVLTHPPFPFPSKKGKLIKVAAQQETAGQQIKQPSAIRLDFPSFLLLRSQTNYVINPSAPVDSDVDIRYSIWTTYLMR